MQRNILKHRHDRAADAIYITLSDKPYAFGEDLAPERRIDYARDGTPIGIELLAVSHGVHLDGLPHADEIGALLQKAGVRLLTTR